MRRGRAVAHLVAGVDEVVVDASHSSTPCFTRSIAMSRYFALALNTAALFSVIQQP